MYLSADAQEPTILGTALIIKLIIFHKEFLWLSLGLTIRWQEYVIYIGWQDIMISHYSDVIMSTMASQINSLTIVYSIVCSSADHRKHQSSASLACVRGIHRWSVISTHKWPVTRKWFHFMTSCYSTPLANHSLVVHVVPKLGFDASVISHF